MRVLLADDDQNVRSALRLVVEQEAGMRVVGEAAEFDSLRLQLRRFHPDLLLLDWDLPGSHPYRTLPSLRNLDPGLRVIALSGRPEARIEALAAGADGFASKAEPPEELIGALHHLAALTAVTAV